MSESSASSPALFKEDLPKKMHMSNKAEFQTEDTMMGNLAKRIQATRFIRSQNLGTIKAREADKVAGADMSSNPGAQLADCGEDSCPKKMVMQDSYDIYKGMQVESEHTKIPEEQKKIAKDHLKESPNYYKDWNAKEKLLFKKEVPKGLGLHEHSTSNSFNSFDPRKEPENQSSEGGNMADQARKAGNVFGITELK